jgi:hypothetical protein
MQTSVCWSIGSSSSKAERDELVNTPNIPWGGGKVMRRMDGTGSRGLPWWREVSGEAGMGAKYNLYMANKIRACIRQLHLQSCISPPLITTSQADLDASINFSYFCLPWPCKSVVYSIFMRERSFIGEPKLRFAISIQGLSNTTSVSCYRSNGLQSMLVIDC